MREARSPRLREAGRPPRGGHTPAAREQPRRGPRRWQRHPPASVAVTAQTIRPPGILPASQLSRHGAETQGRPPRLARSADLCRIENKGVLCLGRRHEDPGRPLGTRRARAGARNSAPTPTNAFAARHVRGPLAGAPPGRPPPAKARHFGSRGGHVVGTNTATPEQFAGPRGQPRSRLCTSSMTVCQERWPSTRLTQDLSPHGWR